MNADKLGRVELPFERTHGLAQKMRTALNVQFRIVVGRADPLSVLAEHDLDAGARPHNEPRELPPAIPSQHLQDAVSHLSFRSRIGESSGPIDGRGKTSAVHRLK